MYVLLIIIAIISIVFIVYFYHNHLILPLNSTCIITGAPKTGKSLLSIYQVYKWYKKALFKYYFKNIWAFILGKDKKSEMPYIYSNIPLKTPYGFIPITKRHLLRLDKINDGSIVYLGEFSLVANSRLGQQKGFNKISNINYDEINEELLLFTKLSGHEWNGKLIIDSQCISDCHYSVKRVLSEYYYIHHNIKLPFFRVLFVKECRYSEDNSSIDTNENSIQDNLKWILVPTKKYFNMYDFRCYSIWTDNKRINNSDDLVFFKNKKRNLKARNIVSFSDFKTLKK